MNPNKKRKSEFSINQIGIVILVLIGLVLALIILGIFSKKLFSTGIGFFK
jgi:predicted nucleic acid-binding Zn ribbon protein